MVIEDKIIEGLNYYLNGKPRSKSIDDGCFYSGANANVKSKGCFIGQFLPLNTRNILDEKLTEKNNFTYAKKYIIDNKLKAPKFLLENEYEELFLDLQRFHDCDIYWDENKLNEYGKNRLTLICKDNKLNYNYIIENLNNG